MQLLALQPNPGAVVCYAGHLPASADAERVHLGRCHNLVHHDARRIHGHSGWRQASSGSCSKRPAAAAAILLRLLRLRLRVLLLCKLLLELVYALLEACQLCFQLLRRAGHGIWGCAQLLPPCSAPRELDMCA